MNWKCGYYVCYLMHVLLNAIARINTNSKMLQVVDEQVPREHQVPLVR